MFENLIASLKVQTNNLTDNIKSKIKARIRSKPSNKNACDCDNDYYSNEFLSPRAYNGQMWPSITDNMQWYPYVPTKLDEHNIVDRFIKVITISDDEYDVCLHFTFINYK